MAHFWIFRPKWPIIDLNDPFWIFWPWWPFIDLNDPFFEFADDGSADGQAETADQKRLRLANKIIDEYAKEDKNDFFETL